MARNAIAVTLSAQVAVSQNMKKTLITIAGVFVLIAAASAAETQAELQKQAKVSMKNARSIALKRVSGGEIQSAELEREGGKLIYSFDVKSKSGITEVNVSAISGKVIALHYETAAKEAAEKKKEATEKH